MSQSKRQDFLFVDCNGPSGRSEAGAKRAKNRHAQLASAATSNDASLHGRGAVPVPVQIRFRLQQKAAEYAQAPAARRGGKTSNARELVSICERCGQQHLSSDPVPSQSDGPSLSESQSVVARTNWTRLRIEDYDYAMAQKYANAVTCVRFAATPFTGPPLHAKELRVMGYFRTYAALELSGYLPGHFWDHLILQLGHCEPLARQAIVAVGSAHLDHCTLATTSADTLTAHSAVLKSLRKYLGSGEMPSYELVLSCCVMLFAVAGMLGDAEAASTHLRNGMAILSNVRNKLRTSGDIAGLIPGGRGESLHRLSVMFVQIDIEATMQALDRGPCLSAEIVVDIAELESWSPDMRGMSPHEAMGMWMCIAHDMWRFISTHAHYRRTPVAEVPSQVVWEQATLQARIKAWRMTTKDFIKTNHAIIAATEAGIGHHAVTPREIVDAMCALIIEGHHFCCKRFLAESLRDDTRPRPFDQNPESLLRTAETALQLRRRYRQLCNIQNVRTFSTHVGIVEALLLVAHRTTSPSTRGKAQYLIRQFKEVQNGASGLADFFEGYGAPPSDFQLILELPGH